MVMITRPPPTTTHAQHKQQEWTTRRSSSAKENRQVIADRFRAALDTTQATRKGLAARTDAHVPNRLNALAADRARFAKRKAQRAAAAQPTPPTLQRGLDPAVLPAVQRPTNAHTAALEQQRR